MLNSVCAVQVKMHWVHRYYWMGGPEGNDIQKTNVPNLRMRYRHDTYQEEMKTVLSGSACHAVRAAAKKAAREAAAAHHHEGGS